MLLYEEVGSLGPKFANLLDLAPFPNVAAWCQRMESLPDFDSAHAALATLGDLSKGELDPKQLGVATKAGLKTLAAVQAESKL